MSVRGMWSCNYHRDCYAVSLHNYDRDCYAVILRNNTGLVCSMRFLLFFITGQECHDT